ncbi:CAMK family protein kinase [Trichomonas vaginalis G3]|uniref:CAMK family protein kinase n=1 Tax=Trichomonas vaginalis (strain ATCC PRA-98 / G3) TaxID=412133 RepID=A2EN63_TRIV3|nr:protein serine/threonine kinase protein [Trichomonas vaginalis G3]EAY05900.1 CAMK family protein kinase [Trichomonas vaginalis G3]KAI5520216.1 protein serine/threonine kinase protein [Trichomonas vaginalis G3]|eukprot:XP_001318123.1 CAMK family protein kinase [Trichomonas vaginalis G3]
MTSTGVQVVAPTKIGPYTIRGTVGEGAFSVVKLAYNEEKQQYYACKIVPKSRLSTHHLEKRFELEIRINQQMHHPGIVGMIDILKDKLNYYVIMEFCPNGELFQYIVDHGRLKEDEARPKIRELLKTLDYIHHMGVTHRDLKPENILLDKFGQLKVSDFGLSRFLDSKGLASTPCGSPCYASPECISGKPYDGITSDVWSSGVILYAMVTGQLPWTKRNQTQLFEQIRHGEYTIPSYLSYQCTDFIRGLMTVDNKKRLTIPQALKHPFLSDTQQVELHDVDASQYISLRRVDDFFDIDISCSSIPTGYRKTDNLSAALLNYEQSSNIIQGKSSTRVRLRPAKFARNARLIRTNEDQKDLIIHSVRRSSIMESTDEPEPKSSASSRAAAATEITSKRHSTGFKKVISIPEEPPKRKAAPRKSADNTEQYEAKPRAVAKRIARPKPVKL